MKELATAVARGQAALALGAWEEARSCFEESLGQRETAEALEGLSWAAWWLNESELLFHTRETSFRLYRQANDNLGAARMATWLSSDYADFRGELAIANGWRQRARHLLDGLPLAPEHGWQVLMEGDAAILLDDDTTVARHRATRAIAIGRELGVADIEVLGLALEGIARVSEGDVDEGMARLDEAAASALGGEMSQHFSTMWALCYLIYACERVRDFDRATQWYDKLREYAERVRSTFAGGVCRAHYAGVLIWRGKWSEAETQLADATAWLQASRPPLASEGIVRLAELRRRQGRLDEAGEIFRQVKWHLLALFGLAELALDHGKPRDAKELIERALRQIPESSRTQRASALELLIRAEALLGNHARAAEALADVRALSEAVPTLPLRAAASFSSGVTAIAAGDYEEARVSFEDAVDLFDRCVAPYELARTRLELASVLVSLDRLESAEVEATAAWEALTQLGSVFQTSRAAALRRDIARRMNENQQSESSDARLTERQVEILRLISQGMNDREIAAALVVSEHTVHRHVANILLRLDLPSRAAAVSYATRHSLL